MNRLLFLAGLGCCLCASCAEFEKAVQKPAPIEDQQPRPVTSGEEKVVPGVGKIEPSPPPGKVITCQVSLGNVRSGPCMQNRIIGTVRLGESVTIKERKGKWLHIAKGDGTAGWCHGSLFYKELRVKQAKKPSAVKEQILESSSKKVEYPDQGNTDERISVPDAPESSSNVDEAADSATETQVNETQVPETQGKDDGKALSEPSSTVSIPEDKPGDDSRGNGTDQGSDRKTMKTWGNGPVKVYRDPSLLSDIIGAVPPDTNVFFLNQIDNFYYIEYADMTGYILKDLAE